MQSGTVREKWASVRSTSQEEGFHTGLNDCVESHNTGLATAQACSVDFCFKHNMNMGVQNRGEIY